LLFALSTVIIPSALAGPFIASKYFFSGSNANNLTNVQWVYLAVACTCTLSTLAAHDSHGVIFLGMGVIVAVLFAFTTLPETSEAELAEQAKISAAVAGHADRSELPFYKQYRVFFGYLAQFLYVG